jgi:hypothetical protein
LRRIIAGMSRGMAARTRNQSACGPLSDMAANQTVMLTLLPGLLDPPAEARLELCASTSLIADDLWP